PEASSINFGRSVTYGLGVLKTSITFRLQKMRLRDSALFSGSGQGVTDEYYDFVPVVGPRRLTS
ncbi:MAG TPA: hypothetical protein VF937_12440, partial [Chloroflexota bacterium]